MAAKKAKRAARKAAPKRNQAAAARRAVGAPRPAALPRKTIDPGWTWDDRLPFAQGKQVGDTIYVSGQVAYDNEGKLVGEGDIKAQTRQALANVKAVLEAAGAKMEDVVKITSYLTDAAKFMEMVEARSEILGELRPASTAVVVAGLARPELMIEVEALAVRS